METKEILLKLRNENNLSQDELANKLFVTRQAVSRWENGETTPNIETLKSLSKLYNVSINTLLGSPQQLFCQCCGMPLDDSTISRDESGEFHEDYCKWCLTESGEYTYKTMDSLLKFITANFPLENMSAEQTSAYYREHLLKLKHWQAN